MDGHAKLRVELKDDFVLLVAGSQAGLVHSFLLYPLDFLRNRIRWKPIVIDKNEVKKSYCIVRVFKEEGFMSFWKGITPHVIVNTPRHAIKFFVFDKFRHLCQNLEFFQRRPGIALMISGFIAGTVDSLYANPFEVIKITQQLDFQHYKKSPSIWSISKNIWKKEGIHGLYKGVDALFFKLSLQNMMSFGIYYRGLQFLRDNYHEVPLVTEASLAFAATSIPALLLYPVSVARIRIQGPQPVGPSGRPIVTYKYLFQTLKLLLKEQRNPKIVQILALRTARTGYAGAATLMAFEHCYHMLDNFSKMFS